MFLLSYEPVINQTNKLQGELYHYKLCSEAKKNIIKSEKTQKYKTVLDKWSVLNTLNEDRTINEKNY